MTRENMIRVICGTIITVASLVIWYLAAREHIDTSAILAFVVPIVGALFITGQLSEARNAAQQAASQTNGALDARIVAGAMHAASIRDAAKTAAIATATSDGQVFPQLPVGNDLENVTG